MRIKARKRERMVEVTVSFRGYHGPLYWTGWMPHVSGLSPLLSMQPGTGDIGKLQGSAALCTLTQDRERPAWDTVELDGKQGTC